MKEVNLKRLITQQVNSIDDNIDLTLSVMERIKNRNSKLGFYNIFKRPLLVLLVAILVSTIAYAVTSQIIVLKNNDGEDAALVEVIDTDRDFHYDAHVNNSDLFNYRVDGEVFKGPVIVIDTSNPDRFDLRYGFPTCYENHGIFAKALSRANKVFLPDQLSDFEFERAFVVNEFVRPTEKEIKELAVQNSNEKFFVHPLKKLNKINSIHYRYKKKDSDEKFSIYIYYSGDANFTAYTSMFSDYKIVNLSNVEAFLRKKRVNAVRYNTSGKAIKIKYENDFSLIWYEPEFDISISCQPVTTHRFKGKFPEDTDEKLKLLGTQINDFLNNEGYKIKHLRDLIILD